MKRFRTNTNGQLRGRAALQSLGFRFVQGDFHRSAALVIDRNTRDVFQFGYEIGIKCEAVERHSGEWRSIFQFAAWRQHARARPTRFAAGLTGIEDSYRHSPLRKPPGARK